MLSRGSGRYRSESLLRAVLDSMSQAVVAIGEAGTIEFVNRQSEITFGYTSAELVGQPVECLLPARYRAAHRQTALRYLHGSPEARASMHRVAGRCRDGQEFPVDIHLNKAVLDDGRLIGIAILTNLSEPDRLRRQREDFFRAAPDLLATLTWAGELEEVNPAFSRVLGWSAEQLKSRTLWSLAHPEERGRAEHEVQKFFDDQSKSIASFETRCVCRDESIRCILWALHTTESGTRIAAGRDVTTTRLLALERHKLAALVEDAPMLVAILSAGRCLSVQHLNPAGRELLGLTESEPLPATDFRQLCGLDAGTAKRIEDALALHGRWTGTADLVHSKTFAPIAVEVEIVGILDGCRSPVSEPATLAVFARDIREKQRDRELLAESEERFRTLLEQSTDPLIVHDEHGRIITVNLQACEDLGYTREEFLRMSVFDIEASFKREELLELWAGMVPGKPTTTQGALRCKDGTVFPIDARVGLCVLRGKNYYMAQTRDISTHLRNEERLRALTAQLLTAREEERRHIARELHDDFTQKLAVIGIEVDFLRASAGEKLGCPEMRTALDSVRSSIISLTDEMRELSHLYHPGMLEHAGLGAAAEAQCQEVSRHSAIPVTIFVRDLPDHLPLDISLTLYRILQEALRNVVRHSGSEAAHVFLTGMQDPPRVVLAVVDHGKGFLVEEIRNGAGLGLLGIEERTRLVRGTLRLSSVPGEGTRLEVEIPLQQQQEEGTNS